MNRKEMARILEEWMTQSYAKLRTSGRIPHGRNLLKTYLIEANAPDVGDKRDAVQRFFSDGPLSRSVTLTQTDDSTIHLLRFERQGVEFFLDTIDPRFWVLHTVAQAHGADTAVRALVHKTGLLDAAWFPARHLAEWATELGSARLLTAKFSVPTGLYQDDLPEDEFLDESLFLRIGATGNAFERWNKFRETEVLKPTLALWSARVARRQPNRDDVVVEDVTAVGKLTCRGTSFRLHQEFLHGLRSKYSELIVGWEAKYRTGWQQQSGSVIPTGNAAEIVLPESLSSVELEHLLSSMFNCGDPYRLYGVPVQQGTQRYVAKGVDLHTGDKIDFEITPEMIRVYLYPTTCGNSLARLVTNLQHFQDARIDLG
jgi:hypothetical protein